MTSRTQASILFAAIVFFQQLSVPPAQADVLVSNYDSPQTTSFPTINSGQWLAQAFTTAAEPSSLMSIMVNLRIYESMEGPVELSILEDVDGLPGEMLPGGELTGVNVQPGLRIDVVYESNGIPLASHSKYWVLASCDFPAVGGQSHGWNWTRQPMVTSNFAWDIPPGWANSFDLGQSWNFNADRPPLFMEISGVLVPEPASVTLMLVLCGLSLRFCRRFY